MNPLIVQVVVDVLLILFSCCVVWQLDRLNDRVRRCEWKNGEAKKAAEKAEAKVDRLLL